MNGCYRRVTVAELEMLRTEPLALSAFLAPPGDLPPPIDRHLDIGGAWQAIHFLLTGHPWAGGPPFANAVLGGEPVSDEDFGYGPVRFLEADQVAAVAAALETVTAEELLSRFDPDALNAAEVYPGGWTDDAAWRAHLEETYGGVRDLFVNAANQGDGMLLYLA
ncbi:MAG TPA: YfbM family protein [Gemmatimonadales bacterium]|nr:YfbM family protein [Gemmatimonadales bacterium]